MTAEVPTRWPRRRRELLLSLSGVFAAVWALGSVWIRVSTEWTGNHALDFVTGAAYLAAGLFALYRRPGNTVGALLLVFGVVWFLLPWAYTLYPPLFPYATILLDSVPALLVHMVLSFPTGRAATVFGRVVIVTTYVWTLATNVAMQCTIDREARAIDENIPTISLWPSVEAFAAIEFAAHVATPILAVATLAAFWQRWLLATPAARRDLRPMWIMIALGAFTYSLRSSIILLVRSDPLQEAVEQFLAVVLISAPLIVVWGLLRARLATSAVSDMVRVIQQPTSPPALERALADALGDPDLGLRFATGQDEWLDTSGQPVRMPHDDGHGIAIIAGPGGEPRAALVHDAGLDQSAVGAAAAAAGLAIENDSLRAQVTAQLAEVQASRARIVEAGYRERRRVERDLHDGAQQRLLSLALALKTARRHLDHPAAIEALDAASGELGEAIDELREFARGIHPSILTDAGLGPAVRALAERTPVPVSVDDRLANRVPARVETAAYFVVAEALTNVAKHAAASHANVQIQTTGSVVSVTIADDGRGGADSSAGTGLRGLRDRVEAAGGTLVIASPSGAGTRVTALLPIDGA